MFVGRQKELGTLENLYKNENFQMAVVYGRRRIGKTTLLNRFVEGKPAVFFTAQEANDSLNLAGFSKAVYSFFKIPLTAGGFESWEDAFCFLAENAEKKRFILVFDEFPYAAGANKSLPSILQNAIDRYLKNSKIFILLCGSQISWMETEVLGAKSPLFGRRTAQIKLEGFDYLDAACFMDGFSNEDKIKLYGCLGGTPHYLAQIDRAQSFEDNIKRLFLDTTSYMYAEPMMLLRQELREPALYNSLMSAIASGASKLNEISTKIGESSAKTIKYIHTLSSMNQLRKEVPFGEDGERSKRGVYAITDNAFLFWYRFVFPNRPIIERGFTAEIAPRILASIPEHIGKPCFEEVCMQYLIRAALAGSLPFTPLTFGRWWGNDPVKKCQTDIDVVAADDFNKKLIVGEAKWRENENISASDAACWMRREYLFPGYLERYYYLFSKKEFSPALFSLAKENARLKLVTLDMMFPGN